MSAEGGNHQVHFDIQPSTPKTNAVASSTVTTVS